MNAQSLIDAVINSNPRRPVITGLVEGDQQRGALAGPMMHVLRSAEYAAIEIHRPIGRDLDLTLVRRNEHFLTLSNAIQRISNEARFR